MSLLKVIRELEAVGIVDWIWFVFTLHRNEYHESLNRSLATDNDSIHHIIKKCYRAESISAKLRKIK